MGVFFAVAFFKEDFRSTLTSECVKHLTELQNSSLPASTGHTSPTDLQNVCSSVFWQSRVAIIVSFSISFLITLYCCIIVHRYGNQLTEEQQFKGNSHAMGQTYAAKDAPQGYYPHTAMTNTPGSQGHYEYPYAQKEHSFGAANH
jgi:hypothetical protein